MEGQRRCRKGKGMMSVLMMAGWGILVHKGRKVGTERQRRSRKGKRMMSILMMASGGQRGERKKG